MLMSMTGSKASHSQAMLMGSHGVVSGSKSIGAVSGNQMAGGVNGGGAPVQVLDEDGNDVTPVPLMMMQGNMKGGLHGGVGGRSTAAIGMGVGITSDMSISSVMKETVADVLNNLESMTMGSWNNSVFGRSNNHSFSNSSRASGNSSPDNERDKDDDGSSIASGDSDGDGDGEKTCCRVDRQT
jgi:hypothetical protein